jgi:hypothetical protein
VSGGSGRDPRKTAEVPWAFLERRDAVPRQVGEHLERILEGLDAGDRNAIRDELEAVESGSKWLTLERFDRRNVNRRLRLYAAGNGR